MINRFQKIILFMLLGICLIAGRMTTVRAMAVETIPAQTTAATEPAAAETEPASGVAGTDASEVQIVSTDSGLQITWKAAGNADKYALYRDNECIAAADASSPVYGSEPKQNPETGVIPISISSAQAMIDQNGNITGYTYTDSLILPGKEYHYYIRGLRTSTGQWSLYNKSGNTGIWNVTAEQIRAGTQLTPEAVGRLGIDSFFYVEEISDETFARMWGKSFKEYCTVPRESLRYIRCLHRNVEGDIKVGELVMAATVADSVCSIFRKLYDAAYPIESMLLVDDFDGSDDDSIMHNNTSAFNYRTVDNTDQISDHAYGLAIDINPFYNVYYIPSENYVFPREYGWNYLDRTPRKEPSYILTEGDLCFNLFLEAGFSWGGWFSYNIDYQHFYYAR